MLPFKTISILSWLCVKKDGQNRICSKQRPPSCLEVLQQSKQCTVYSQCRFVHQTAVVTVKTVGLPQHLEERWPIPWTNTPQRTATRWLKRIQINTVIELFYLKPDLLNVEGLNSPGSCPSECDRSFYSVKDCVEQSSSIHQWLFGSRGNSSQSTHRCLWLEASSRVNLR